MRENLSFLLLAAIAVLCLLLVFHLRRQLQTCQRRLDYFAATLAGGLCQRAADETERIAYLDGGCASLFGYGPEELLAAIQHRYPALIVPEDLPRVRQERQQQLAEGDQVELIYRGRRKDGSQIWLLETSRLASDEKGNTWFYSTLQDLQADREQQQRREKNLPPLS